MFAHLNQKHYSVVDGKGRPQFNDLLFRSGDPGFLAFDLVYLNGIDLRTEPLTSRKKWLKEILADANAERLLYVDHFEDEGAGLFEQVCRLDLEGIVAKHKQGAYVAERENSSWFKVRNRAYSQMNGRLSCSNQGKKSTPNCGSLAPPQLLRVALPDFSNQAPPGFESMM